MRARRSAKFVQIRILTAELAALGRLKNPHRLIMGKTVLPLFLSCFYPIPFILTGNDDMHESSKEFEIRPDPTTDCGVSCPLASEKIPIDL